MEENGKEGENNKFVVVTFLLEDMKAKNEDDEVSAIVVENEEKENEIAIIEGIASNGEFEMIKLEIHIFNNKVGKEENKLQWKEEIKSIVILLEVNCTTDEPEELNGAMKNERKEVGEANKNEVNLESY